ncbi:TPA: aminoglycoside 6-adenylyltransferase [Streptococcus pyogenes]
MIVFGDNLQFLKTINENKDPLIKDKVKGKVKLIYIDPPFATQDEFENKEGAKAYSDKKKGSEFLEFIRRRLILAKEILSDDGSIYVHLDEKMVDYIKTIMDEIFGKNNYKRQIIWFTKTSSGYKTKAENWIRGHDVILYYSKSDNPIFNKQYILDYKKEYLARFKKIDDNGRKYRDDRSNGERQYLDELKGIAINDVWDVTPYVIKGLCRKEILFAIDHFNQIVRHELLRMISWKVGIETGFKLSVGKNYKFIERYISEDLWEKLLSTYRMDSYENIWEALFLCHQLFRAVSGEVAERLHYAYPEYDRNITKYTRDMYKKYTGKTGCLDSTYAADIEERREQ